MSSAYFTYTPLVSFILARAADVNARFLLVEAGFDKFPAIDLLKQSRVTHISAGGTANALTATLAQPILAYTAGLKLSVLATATNTTAATINVDGLGNKAIVRTDGSALSAGDIISGRIYEMRYNGTSFQLLQPADYQIAAAASAAAAAASALSVDAANIVHRTGNESIDGIKTFAQNIYSNGALITGANITSGIATFGNQASGTTNISWSSGVYSFTTSDVIAAYISSNGIDLSAPGHGTKLTLTSGHILGTQPSTIYVRTNLRFSVYLNGTHVTAENDPGSGGSVAMTWSPNSPDYGLTVTGMVTASNAVRGGSFTVATMPSPSVYARGIIYVSDESGGATTAFSDGTNWRRHSDRAVVS